jgi:hypothetical protein
MFDRSWIRARRANHFLAIHDHARVLLAHSRLDGVARQLLVWWWCVMLGAAIGHMVDSWSLREAIMKKQIMLGIIVGAAVIATPVSFNAPREGQAIVTLNSAEAKVGQPLSATSVAGVNRRQGRREKRKSN